MLGKLGGFRRVLGYLGVALGTAALAFTATGCWHGRVSAKRYQMIPASAFHMGKADDDTWDIDHLASQGAFGWISGGNAPYDVRLYAPVILPHGAVVTELTAYYLDKADADISQLDLLLKYQGTGANVLMAQVSVATTGRLNSVTSQSDSSVSNPRIDASVNRVWLSLGMTVTAPSVDLRFYGARVTYQMSR